VFRNVYGNSSPGELPAAIAAPTPLTSVGSVAYLEERLELVLL